MNAPHTPLTSNIDPPSLDEILQTIRGVIAESDNTATTDDILLLTTMVKEDGSVENIRSTPRVSSPFKEEKEPYSAAHHTDSSLLSEKTAAASSKALNELLQASKKTDTAPNNPTPPFRSGHTLEDLVMELLKPQLREWLDRHLPAIIERLVAKEIEKLNPRNSNGRQTGH